MKSLLKLSFLFVPLLISTATSKQNSLKIISYEIKVNYSGDKQLQIQAELTACKNPFDNKIFFLVDTNANFKNVMIEREKKSFNIPFVRNNDTLSIQIPSTFVGLNEIHLLFSYTFGFDSLYEGIKTLRFWYPYLWDNIAKYKIISQTSNKYTILFPGILLIKKTNTKSTESIWEMDKPIPSLFMIIAKTNAYEVTKVLLHGKVINFYFLYKDEYILTRFKNESLKAFEFFNNYLGQYKYKGLTFIEVPGMNYINS